MKNLIPLAFMAAIVLTSTSCKKKYTCNCTYTDNIGMTKTNTGTISGTKSQAESACNANKEDLKTIGTNVSCQLN